jgi:hypothetical protein
MADTAFQTLYRDEFIAGFEKKESLARKTVTTEYTRDGAQNVVFLVADSGGATAVTRGVNGDIPTRPDNLNQYTTVLQEWHDVPERTGFNIFASQGNGRAIMQRTSMAVVNRKMDKDIHAALDAGTNTLTMTTASAAEFLGDNLQLIRDLSENNAFEEDNEAFALVTPGYFVNLQALEQFSSADYVNEKTFGRSVPKAKAFMWNGINYMMDTDLTGVGGTTATCYAYVKSAIGHACDTENMQTFVGYDEKNDKSWARCTTYMGSKLLQNSGVLKLTHNDNVIIGQ